MRRYVVPILTASVVGLIVGPVLGPTLARLGRPVMKSGIRFAVASYQRGRVVAEEMGESVSDMVHEAQEELRPDVTES